MANNIELAPIGTILFFDKDINPAEEFPGTMWEEMINDLYISSNQAQHIDSSGNPTGPYTKLIAWLRLL